MLNPNCLLIARFIYTVFFFSRAIISSSFYDLVFSSFRCACIHQKAGMCTFSESAMSRVHLAKSGVFSAGATFTQKLLYTIRSNAVFLLAPLCAVCCTAHCLCPCDWTQTVKYICRLKINRNSIRMPFGMFLPQDFRQKKTEDGGKKSYKLYRTFHKTWL